VLNFGKGGGGGNTAHVILTVNKGGRPPQSSVDPPMHCILIPNSKLKEQVTLINTFYCKN
jgi:hypothetical protein